MSQAVPAWRNSEVNAALADSAFGTQLRGLGYAVIAVEVIAGGAVQMADFIATGAARWRRVVLERGLKLE